MSFTDEKPRVATRDQCNNWGRKENGERFRCYLCGYKFIPGDYWRWVLCSPLINFLVCENCDGEDVKERWDTQNKELEARFWWAV